MQNATKCGRPLSENQAAEKFGIPIRRLQNDRFRKSDGLPFLRLGRSIFYDEDEIHAYQAGLKRRSTSDRGGGAACYTHNLHSLSEIEAEFGSSSESSEKPCQPSSIGGNSQ